MAKSRRRRFVPWGRLQNAWPLQERGAALSAPFFVGESFKQLVERRINNLHAYFIDQVPTGNHFGGNLLSDDLLRDYARHVRQAEVAATVVVGQLLVVEPE